MKKTNPRDKEWAAIQILEERGGKYLIEWAGIDPSTQKPWAPTWEPKKLANKALAREWQHKKRRQSQATLPNTKDKSSIPVDSPNTTLPGGDTQTEGSNDLAEVNIHIKASQEDELEDELIPLAEFVPAPITTPEQYTTIVDDLPLHVVQAVASDLLWILD
ncbi:uncharacterized protein PGTG_02002 [Puccinia graminis f. sp. tritici CRL 75-36-700-3]|uniref:Chromo domain-containing protein n=1 Tax=Puccinia graminis f. sp. tritici (strain CRL 75-36-700-3 / race SCCL) TaxID=418459 RepID=E3JTN4_PUCGT|nr:uncharacterized protein PGTG_02002 [Puccinia graminis f. sp. tritici CRL 75-36-700-3]EFP75409.1 hypothetical protein PGTG_02002 [Puccinia graminis f. sp. tritici CRL 75-36-700-3]